MAILLDTQEPFFRCSPLVRIPMSGEAVLVYLPLHQTAHLLGHADLDAALRCTQFKRLRDHADTLSQDGLPFAGDGNALSRLSALSAQKVLISLQEIVGRNNLATQSSLRVSYLAVPTSNRSVELERALRSYLANFAHYGRTSRVLVADDSDTGEDRLTMEAVKAANAKYGLPAAYVGRQEKERLLSLLTANDQIPRHVVEFTLVQNRLLQSEIGRVPSYT